MSEENVEIVRGIYTVPDASPRAASERLAPDVQFDFTSVKGQRRFGFGVTLRSEGQP